MNKHDIFNHLIDSVIYIGQKGKFETEVNENKSLFTGLNSPVFNYVSFGSYEPHLIEALKEKKLPFICFSQSHIAEGFPKWCDENSLVKADEVMTHKFENLDTWNHDEDSSIRIENVSDEKRLKAFDFISSSVFGHAPQAAFDFFRPILNDTNILLFVAYHDDTPAGCGMVSLVNNIAGLYWGGVLAEYRGRGMGRQLTQHRMNYIKQQGFKSIIAQNLSPSISYYQKIGFKPIGSLPLYLYSGTNL